MTTESTLLPAKNIEIRPDWLAVSSCVFGNTSGARSGLKACKAVCQWMKEGENLLGLNEEQIKSVKNGIDMFGGAETCLVVTKIPITLSNLQSIRKKYSDLSAKEGVGAQALNRARDRLFKSIAELIGDFSKAALLFARNSTIQLTSKSADLMKGVFDLRVNSKKVVTFRNDLEAVEKVPVAEEVKTRLIEEQRHSMLKTVKTVVSIVGTIMALGAMLFSLPFSSLSTLTVSSISLTLGLWGKFYKESMTHELRARY